MKLKLIIMSVLAILLSACNSTSISTSQNTKTFSNKKAYTYEPVKISNPQEATISDYVYFAANQADSKDYKKFALVREYTKHSSGKFFPNKITMFMFDKEDDFKELARYEKPYRKLKLLGVFDTEEYKNARFVPIGSLSGVA
ncbi:hypothetical protein A3K86_03600 [Photobacterium jeanii]|uniref:Lipoprotein n=1 Tax=Photobacterium jeanii TaxID=858640 RepID=A0A178KL78_9GAMM|nr:hypothetical protein [Photobacterium jeanii]OAN18017.1 hypothetical protein A3K86_03600 [Photobacterium jeanii]PST92314.1 hypothetical protein C9I91_03840 [Photobacterium jeanii]